MTTKVQTDSSREQIMKLTSESLSGGTQEPCARTWGRRGGTRGQHPSPTGPNASPTDPQSLRPSQPVVPLFNKARRPSSRDCSHKHICKQSKYIKENKTQKESTKSIAIKFKSINKTDMENDHKLKKSASRPTTGNLEI